MKLVPETGGKALFNVEHGIREVSPLSDAVQVFDSTGALLTRVEAGESLSFDSPDQGGGAQGPSSGNSTKKKGGAAGTASEAGKHGGMSTGAKTALALTVIGGSVGWGAGVYEATKRN